MIQWVNTGVIQVTSTTTATSLKDLMNTAVAGKGTAAHLLRPNYVLLNPEAVIRACYDGGTPTATTGIELIDLSQAFVEAPLDKIMLYNTGVVNIMVGRKTAD